MQEGRGNFTDCVNLRFTEMKSRENLGDSLCDFLSTSAFPVCSNVTLLTSEVNFTLSLTFILILYPSIHSFLLPNVFPLAFLLYFCMHLYFPVQSESYFVMYAVLIIAYIQETCHVTVDRDLSLSNLLLRLAS